MTEWLMRTFVKNYEHAKDPQVRNSAGSTAGLVGIVCNVLLCGAKGAIGLLAGSVAIVADALNNLSDAASNIISLLGFRMASKPADTDHPYGHGRYEYLSGLVVAAMILVVGFELLKTSFDKVFNPEPVDFSWALVVVLALSILVKLWMMVFNKKVGDHINSQTLIATSVDSRNDVITTAAVLIAALVSHFSGVELDAYMGMAVAAFILYSGVGLLKDTIDPLLGRPADPELVEHIQEKTMSYPGVLGIHDLIVHDYGPGRVFASVHAEVPAETPILESHDIIDRIEQDFRRDDHMEVVIHLDPVVTKDPRVSQLREWIDGLVKEIDPSMSIHDFRMVPGDTHTNLIFDCVEPYEVPIEPSELKRIIQSKVWQTYPDHNCVIQVDRSFVM